MTTPGSRTGQDEVFNKPTRIGNTQFVYDPAHEKVKTLSGGRTTIIARAAVTSKKAAAPASPDQ